MGSSALTFTGERLVPGQVEADLYFEHITRYQFAASFAAGRRVLDAGCGVGYGVRLLAQTAASAVGIDIADDAIRYAAGEYDAASLAYVIGAVERLPFADAAFDLIVSFEVIEHLPDPAQFLAELARVLAPDGLLIVSTPNKRRYSDALPGYVNPFHHHEFYRDEWVQLLGAVFPAVRHVAQGYAQALTFQPAGPHGPGEHAIRPVLEQLPAERSRDDVLAEAQFFIALCGQREECLPAVAAQFYSLPGSNILDEKDRWIAALRQQVAEAHAEVERAAAIITDLHAQLTEQGEWAQTSARGVAERDTIIRQLQAQLAAQGVAERATPAGAAGQRGLHEGAFGAQGDPTARESASLAHYLQRLNGAVARWRGKGGGDD